MQKFKVNDMFVSVQGEGIDVGMRCLFIRFAGCNLNCEWCDTEWNTVAFECDSIELIEKVKEHQGIGYVILTGGEPLIQNGEELESLCISLRGMGYKVAVETNGTIAPTKFGAPRLMFDLMAISPKLGSAKNKVSAEYTHTAEWSNLTKVQVKFVIANEQDMHEALLYMSDYAFDKDTVLIFQPEAGTVEDSGYQKMLEYYLDETGGIDLGFETRFLPQIHKMVNVK